MSSLSDAVGSLRGSIRQFEQVIRYYGIGIINSAFGYGLYALLVTFLHNIYISQLISHVTGAMFNFLMFKLHVFRNLTPSVPRYILAYGVNYMLGFGCLFAFHQFVASAYLAGFLSLVATSVINYFVLKSFVFRRSKPDG